LASKPFIRLTLLAKEAFYGTERQGVVERRSKRGHTGLRSNLRNPDGPSVRFPLSVGIIYAYLGKPKEGNKKIPSPLFFVIIKLLG